MKQGRGSHFFIQDEKSGSVIVQWNDNSIVTLVSNVHPVFPMNQVSRWSNKEYKVISVNQPHAISAYNKSMGSVDPCTAFPFEPRNCGRQCSPSCSVHLLTIHGFCTDSQSITAMRNMIYKNSPGALCLSIFIGILKQLTRSVSHRRSVCYRKYDSTEWIM